VSDNAVTVKLALVNEKRNVGEKLRSPVEAALRELDFLLIDLPPGTGDAQLALSQKLALTGTIIVSTPQPVALSDAMKGLRMFQQA
jgi:Mrp family chromosome partitioning ATPase